MQQARKILKSNDIGVKTVPISFDQTLKFETNAKRGWDVYPDKTATVIISPRSNHHSLPLSLLPL